MCPASLSIWDLMWPGLSQVLRVLITTAVSSSVGLPRCAQTLLPGFYILPALSSAVISGSCGDGAVDIALLVLSIWESLALCTVAHDRSLRLSPSTVNRSFSEESW